MQMRKKIENKLLELGITPNLKGFGCIVDAVEYVLKDDSCLMKNLYIEISNKHGLGGCASAERVIRHAISKVDEEKWKAMGGQGMRNAEFLFTLAFILKGEIENE